MCVCVCVCMCVRVLQHHLQNESLVDVPLGHACLELTRLKEARKELIHDLDEVVGGWVDGWVGEWMGG